ncbi:MAG TPA: FAD binding domain-containing protein [Solirubrobacter sp.]|nr:FAD binding domain-containing protein [Solirubrobacter sp.]
MKPAAFDYVAPATVEEALAALGEDACVLAGGQSLVPLLNQRLVRPARVVDINRIPGLGVLRRRDGTLRIGATVRQAALERSALVAQRWPLLAQAVRHVGHHATRARGTVAGSVAHGDPRAQLPAALTALDARLELRSAAGGRTAAAGEFDAPAPDEILLEIHVPAPAIGARTAFVQYARTRGEFPRAGVAVVLARGHAAVAVLGAGRASAAEAALVDGAGAREAAALAAESVDGAHRRALVEELTRRALVEAGRP